jgi:hypothetical protein
MAETTTTNVAPATFIEGESKLYLDELKKAIGNLKGADLSTILGPQFIADTDLLSKRAQDLAVSGVGSYQPYLQEAGRLAGLAETTLGGVPADIAAARSSLGTAAEDFAAARGMIGPEAYKQFMSPYQQDVIDTTLQEYDFQAAKGAQGVPAAAIAAGAFGGGREGVQRAEYQSSSDRNRAGIQAQLLQQGFGQANQLAQQAQAQRMGVGAAQAGLAGQQLGVGQSQMGLGQLYQGLGNQQIGFGQAGQGFLGKDISALTTLGGMNQAQNQAQLSAQQQLLSQQLYQPLTTAQQYGSGIMGLISGYPGQTVTQTSPSPSPLQTGISAGATLAGLYRAFN